MIDKVAGLNSILTEVQELVQHEGDFGTLDALLRKTKLLIKHFFDPNSDYLSDLIKIEEYFPKDDPKISTDDLQYYWIGGCEKLENLLNTMMADIGLSNNTETKLPIKAKTKSVFIVHGLDYEPVKQLQAILLRVGVNPIVLHEQPNKGLTIIEKLEEYSDVGYAFILLTPDDIGVKRQIISECYKAYNLGKEAPNSEIINWAKNIPRPYAQFLADRIQPDIQNRARQNVVLEFGYFIGKLGRSKVCCLYKGDLELPSDMHGICYVPFINSVEEVETKILNELRAAKII